MKPASLLTGVLFLVLTAPVFADWEGCSIGSTSQSSIQTSSANSFAITATGSPLTGASDSIGFASGPGKLNGDCQVVARVSRIESTAQEWVNGGLMIRESLGANSRFVALACTGARGVGSFVRSEESGAVASQDDCPDCTPPIWLKIVRTGNHFTCSKSNDGSVWVQVFQADLPLKKALWVGVFATSGGGPGGNAGATISFDRVAARENASQE